MEWYVSVQEDKCGLAKAVLVRNKVKNIAKRAT